MYRNGRQALDNEAIRARCLEELRLRLGDSLTPEAWLCLVEGGAQGGIRFEKQEITVLHAESAEGPLPDTSGAEIEWLATRNQGHLDALAQDATVAWFDEPAGCVQMGMDLQWMAAELRLRVGVYTGLGIIASFRLDGTLRRALLGRVPKQAARLAATAATGSIIIAPETYALVREDLQANSGGCLLTEEFQNSDLAQACLTPIARGGALSTFAGLGSLRS